MVVSRTKSDVIPYVCRADRALPAEQQTQFLLRPLSSKVVLATQNLRAGGEMQVGTAMLLALKAGLAGWRNFPDPEGKPTPFEQETGVQLVFGVEVDRPVTDATLERVPKDLLIELATAIHTEGKLQDADIPN